MRLRILQTITAMAVAIIISLPVNAQVGLKFDSFALNAGLVVGDTVNVSVFTDSSLTGKGALAFTSKLIYDDTYLIPIAVKTDSGLINDAGWSVTPNLTDKEVITLAAAGTNELSGSGHLFSIDFVLMRQGTGFVSFDQTNTFFNESSNDILIDFENNSQISISAKPTIQVSIPNSGVIVLGDSVQASVFSQEDPITWSVSDTTLASVKQNGIVQSKAYGTVQVIAEDNRGIRDSSDLKILGFELSGIDTTNFQGQEVSVFITTTDLTSLNAQSGAFFLNTPTSQFDVMEVVKGDLLDGGATLNYNVESNGISFAFAQTSNISGSGNLIEMKLRYSSDQTFTYFPSFSDVLINENVEGRGKNFRVQSISLPSLSISNNTLPQYLVGDSLQFSVSNNTGPVQWSVSNPNLATIDSSGKLISTNGGTFKVSAQDSIGSEAESGEFTFYDVLVDLADTSMLLSDTLMFPVQLGNIERSNSEILSGDITFTYNNTQLDYLGYSTNGSLSESWSFAENQLANNKVKLVGGGANPIEQDGDFVYLIFKPDTSINSDLTSYLTLNEALLNEGEPNNLKQNGQIFISSKPLTPDLFSPTNGEQNISLNPTLDWNNAVGADSYDVQLSTNVSFSSPLLDTTGVLTDEISVSNLFGSTNYYWRVRSVNSSGMSNWSPTWFFKTQDPVPEAPVLTTPSDGAIDQVLTTIVRWSSVTFATSYKVELSTDSLFSSSILDSTVSSSNTSMLLPDLDYDSNYYWRVFAANATGESVSSEVRKFTTEDGLPDVPQIIAPADNANDLDTLVSFSWQSATDAEGYEIQISGDSLFSSLVFQDSLVTTSVSDLKLEFNTNYFWRVRGYNSVGTSNWSVVRSFNTRVQEPEIPELIIPTNAESEVDTLTIFSWSAAERADDYILEISSDSLFSSIFIQSTTTDTILSKGGFNFLETYYWRVKATNLGGESDYSDIFKFTIKAEDASIPSLISPSNNAASVELSPIFTWSNAQGAVNYQFQLSEQLDFSSFTEDRTLSDTTTGVSGDLNFETSYYWRVRGIGATDSSNWSPVFIFTTTFDKPAVPTLVSPADEAAAVEVITDFVWNSVENADSYTLELSTDNLFSTVLFDTTLSDTVQRVGNLDYLQTYYWRVKAANTAGESGYSNVFSFSVKAEEASIPDLIAPANNATGIELSPVFIWSNAQGAMSYQFQLSEQSDFSTLIEDQALPDTTAGISGDLAFETSYYWRVRGIGAADSSDWSPVFNFTTTEDLPAIPMLLSPSNNAIDQEITNTFEWQKIVEANSYTIEISEEELFSTTFFDSTLNDTSVFVENFEYSKTYFWRVKANNSAEEGNFSSAFSFSVQEKPNSAPEVVESLGEIILDEDFGTQFIASLDSVFSDDKTGMTFQILSSTSNIESSISNDSLFVSSIQDSSGSNQVVVKAIDVDGLSANDTLIVNILDVNDLPLFSGVPDTLSFSTNTNGILNFLNKVEDVETPFNELSFSAEVSPEDIIVVLDVENSLLTLSSDGYTGEGLLIFTAIDEDDDSTSVEVVLNISMGTSNESEDIPIEFSLSQNYPNPFNPSSTIRFGIPEAAVVKLEVYNLLGQKVKTLIDERKSAGFHTVKFDAADLSSGMYIYRIQAGNFVNIKKMTLIK